jgi:hypothetical protein
VLYSAFPSSSALLRSLTLLLDSALLPSCFPRYSATPLLGFFRCYDLLCCSAVLICCSSVQPSRSTQTFCPAQTFCSPGSSALLDLLRLFCPAPLPVNSCALFSSPAQLNSSDELFFQFLRYSSAQLLPLRCSAVLICCSTVQPFCSTLPPSYTLQLSSTLLVSSTVLLSTFLLFRPSAQLSPYALSALLPGSSALPDLLRLFCPAPYRLTLLLYSAFPSSNSALPRSSTLLLDSALLPSCFPSYSASLPPFSAQLNSPA